MYKNLITGRHDVDSTNNAGEAETARGEFEQSLIENDQAQVAERFPSARWIVDQGIGYIRAGEIPLSSQFSILDPYAESLAWRDAAERVGN